MTNSKRRMVITGMGVIAANGNNKEEFFQAMADGKSGLASTKLLKDIGTKTSVAGQADMNVSDPEYPYDKERTLVMACKVLDEMFEDSGLTREDISNLGMRAGITISTTLWGNIRIIKYVDEMQKKGSSSPDWLIDLPSFVSQSAKYAGVKGPACTTMSACAAGTAGAGVALDYIRNGRTDVMIILGSDPLTIFSAAGFHSLNTMSMNGCKPFDKDRDGMSLGEGAAAFMVETLDRAIERKARIYGEILGYGIGNDGYHMTSPDPEGVGAFKTMTMALKDAAICKDEIDYINVHGTGTHLNDIMETNAISRIYDNESRRGEVLISSTKSMTGHCLGAAGSLELAAIVMAVNRGIAPPTSNLENPEDAFEGFNLVKGKGIKKDIGKAMSNSFAFAGNSASIIVGKYEKEI